MAEAAPPDQPPAAPPPATGFRHTLWFLVAFYAFAVLWGVRSVWYWEPSMLDLPATIAFAITLGWWAVVAARRRRHPIPIFAQM